MGYFWAIFWLFSGLFLAIFHTWIVPMLNNCFFFFQFVWDPIPTKSIVCRCFFTNLPSDFFTISKLELAPLPKKITYHQACELKMCKTASHCVSKCKFLQSLTKSFFFYKKIHFCNYLLTHFLAIFGLFLRYLWAIFGLFLAIFHTWIVPMLNNCFFFLSVCSVLIFNFKYLRPHTNQIHCV